MYFFYPLVMNSKLSSSKISNSLLMQMFTK